MRIPSGWRAQVHGTFLPLLSFGALCPAAVTGEHAVAQAYTFRIREGGKVDVQMDIEFQIAVGSTLSGSYKSILDSTNTKSVENGVVTAEDSSGKPVQLRLENVNGWLQAKFTFPEEVRGDGSSKYSLSLKYTVLNGLCSAQSSGVKDLRFYFPWNHRWRVMVTRSTYRIEFPDNADAVGDMNEVCLGGTSFHRRCGRMGLKVNGASAEHKATGFPHGLFFQWPRRLYRAAAFAARTCPGCGAADGCVGEEVEAAKVRGNSRGKMLPQDEDIKTSAASTVVVVLAILLCCFLAVASALLRRKLSQWTPPGSALEEASLKSAANLDLPILMPLDAQRKIDDIEGGSPATPPVRPHNDDDAFSDIPEEKGGVPALEPMSTAGQRPSQLFERPLGAVPLLRETPGPPSPQALGSPSPQAIGSRSLAGITIDMDASPCSGTPSPQSGYAPGWGQGALSPSPQDGAWKQAQRHWQGFGENHGADTTSPSGASSSYAGSPSQFAMPSPFFPPKHLKDFVADEDADVNFIAITSPSHQDGLIAHCAKSAQSSEAPESPTRNIHPNSPRVTPRGSPVGGAGLGSSPGSADDSPAVEDEFAGFEEILDTHDVTSSPSNDTPPARKLKGYGSQASPRPSEDQTQRSPYDDQKVEGNDASPSRKPRPQATWLVQLDRSGGDPLGIQWHSSNLRGDVVVIAAAGPLSHGLCTPWNAANPSKAVAIGDTILEVNGFSDATHMQLALEQHQVLNIVFGRDCRDQALEALTPRSMDTI